MEESKVLEIGGLGLWLVGFLKGLVRGMVHCG